MQPRVASAFLTTLVMGLFLASCGDEDDGPAAPSRYTDPAALVGGFEAGFTARSVDACVALLQAPGSGSAGFRFYPKNEDLDALDWLAGQSWGHEREVGILANCFDGTFVCDEANAHGFTGIGPLNLQVVSADPLPDGGYDVLTQGSFMLRRAVGEGLPCGVMLRLRLATSTDGSLVIREMREVPVPGRAASPDVPFSWGLVQSWYRERPPRYSDPATLIAAHAAALKARDLEAYAGLLHDAFEYFPQSEDLIDFPWMQGALSWSRAEEVGMIRHMFDPDFVPADYAAPVESINATISILAQQTLPDGTRVVRAGSVFTVMYITGYGARADVRLEFALVTAPDGFLRIRSIRELPPYLRAVDPTSWATIKNLYRG